MLHVVMLSVMALCLSLSQKPVFAYLYFLARLIHIIKKRGILVTSVLVVFLVYVASMDKLQLTDKAHKVLNSISGCMHELSKNSLT